MSITRSISSSVVSFNGFGMAVGNVHQHIKLAESQRSFRPQAFTASASAAFRLNRDSFSTTLFNRFDQAGAAAGVLEYVMATLAPSAARRLGDCRANAA